MIKIKLNKNNKNNTKNYKLLFFPEYKSRKDMKGLDSDLEERKSQEHCIYTGYSLVRNTTVQPEAYSDRGEPTFNLP